MNRKTFLTSVRKIEKSMTTAVKSNRYFTDAHWGYNPRTKKTTRVPEAVGGRAENHTEMVCEESLG